MKCVYISSNAYGKLEIELVTYKYTPHCFVTGLAAKLK